MAATTETEIFNFEGNLEQGFRDWFDAKVLELSTSNDPQTLPEDFIAIEVAIGAATGHASFKPDGSSEYSQYSFSIDFTIRTERGEDDVSQDVNIKRRHQEIVALCRRWLAVSNARGSLDPYLPLYEINTLTPSGTARDASESFDYDETTLTYSGQFDILTTAWPA